ncbi:HAD family hydrolase [Natrialba aegyptia]|uniref:Haloacid dehalogenase n=1 Tax=Natrialba aegyptia DSM 13077 TaxID=1227491 RepID=M0ANA5_9EURY|nr:HAD family hydrolase [Natrialba aegyptia]ELZ00211.1 haloacid dehalogenase [Natrialba aegyptia DSM 13077]
MSTDPLSAIETVTFDLDGTLLQYERSPGTVLEAAFERMGVDPLFSVDEYYARYDEFAERCDSMDELRADCFAALAAENGYARLLGRDVAAAFSDERDQSNVELLPGAARVLDELSCEYRLGVVTNGARDAQRAKAAAVGLERWIETMLVAGHDTPPKPDSEPFIRVVRALDSTPATALHVGDSLETDIAGASAAGLDSVWISAGSDARGYEPTYRVASIDELRDRPWCSDANGASESGAETR